MKLFLTYLVLSLLVCLAFAVSLATEHWRAGKKPFKP